MTTVTVVLGGPNTGKGLVGRAIREFIDRSENHSAAAIEGTQIAFSNRASLQNVSDLILISSSEQREPWMDEYIERFGEPLFTIRIERHRE